MSRPRSTAQLALADASWDPVAALRVRMGLHTGVAEVRDGDYYGSALNRAARLMSVAHGGQIVVSQVTEELVHDFLAADVESVDLGEHRLRDLASPIRVFQIVHPALDRDFPRLRSLDAFGGNLPVQLTSFVGRDDDVARIVAMLGETSLVTLIGTGGVGKTRLAIQSAAEVVPRFADGAWFCELASADDDGDDGAGRRGDVGVRPAARAVAGGQHRRVRQGTRVVAGARQLRAPPGRGRASSPRRSSGRVRGCRCSRPAGRRSRSRASG